MKYKLLGRSGLRVSELCLGTMTFGEEWGWGASHAECRRMFDAFVEAGGNFIDTANVYTNGSAETVVGEMLADDRNRFVLATKYSLSTSPRDPNASGNHRKNMVQALEASLQRLRTDHVDVFWVHAWDFLTPVEEVMRGLDDLVRAGKVLYVGASDTPAWIVAQANTLADLRGWTRFNALQIEYSLIQRTVEREYLPMARALDLAVTAWGPLGGGVLTGKYSSSGATDSKRAAMNLWRVTDKSLAVADTVAAIARETGRTPSQIALAWARQQGVIPVLGARTLGQLVDNLGSLQVELGPEQLDRLGAVSAIELGFPYDFLARDAIRTILYGETRDAIVSHRPR